ncbi:hypothetical protein H312_03613 [Anncaliia algerae PRA339]|uniref:Elongin-C n=1 Tax=Anncaliia algerae PRA339 TaxID=1288291 RepID=A0A059EW81_9MICR|nr:hypothetical protein H312_03613 [Anncaliia algerae PRA339]
MNETVKLISKENKVYIIEEKAANYSGLLRVLFKNINYVENTDREVKLPFSNKLLDIAVSYMEYRKKYSTYDGPIPDFEIREGDEIDLLEVSNFLQL